MWINNKCTTQQPEMFSTQLIRHNLVSSWERLLKKENPKVVLLGAFLDTVFDINHLYLQCITHAIKYCTVTGMIVDILFHSMDGR